MRDDYINKIGQRIKHLRKAKGISLERLGWDIGIDGSNMNKIEKGQNITMDTLIKILIVLDASPDKFFSEIVWDFTPEDIYV